MNNTINYLSQLTYTGQGPLDGKLQPVATYPDLLAIPRSQRFIGMTVVVNNDEYNNGKQTEYWLKDGTTNASWTQKRSPASVVVSGDDIE